MKWNTNLYDQKHDFVSGYGKDVIKLLAPEKGEDILDLGCGTGDLAEIISQTGANVLGIDSSEEMIKRAREKYPHIEFMVASADNFSFGKKMDAVFSNATLHWVLEKEKAVDCIYNSLKKGGRFVAEFGGKGNVGNIVSALRSTLEKHGYVDLAQKQLWYFPSLSEYTFLLETKGFRVEWASHFDRDTPLKDNDGMKNWIYMFGKSFLETLDDSITEQILSEVEEKVRPTNFKDNQWYADYVRLRVVAVKQ
ncbi:class I SAM-dependent methyltransferase [Mariniphaga sediminis]|jgi:trans-aconitate methyltransferase|uniref:class I SAM-dependent methyltransferase n=1 Tax=Mariniphaga sediminis TaxID=1628158 RepID=UPI003564EEE4